jgi:hypothetical protein
MAALWGIYIAEAPAIFISQFHAHAKYRLAGFSSPLRAIFDDVLSRYINFFTPEGPPGSKLKLGILIVYWTGIALAALVPALRRAPGVLLLLLLSGLYYTELALLDGAQFPHYMVHVISVWALLLAAISGVAISRKLIPVPILVGVLAVFVLLQISGHAIKIRHNTYHTDYLPTIAFVQQHSDSQTLVMGPSQLQFGLSGRTLVDDARLGGLSGLSPGLIVLDQAHPGAKAFEGREPDMVAHVSEVLTKRFYLAASYADYHIYLPRNSAARP